MAGAVPSRWVERAEGEAPGGASAEIERRHAEMALHDDNPEEPGASARRNETVDRGASSGDRSGASDLERVFGWEDKFRRLLLRFERLSQLHYEFQTLAYTMINLRHFC